MKKQVKAWAVCLPTDDGFIPDFNVDGKMEGVMQIHSSKRGATKLVKELGGDWAVTPCTITYDY